MEAIANAKERILLTLATGTGKTFIAFQIAWKLFQSRWNLKRDGSRRPRILFLADRNILADQAYNSFSAFQEDALVRINPKEIRKKGTVPTNGSIFFTIFQTFMSGRDAEGNPEPYFGEYPNDFFDFIIIDECHRGGANDEGNWRSILNYFAPAVQLGLTATPKRKDNVDTYGYFGDPVYIYSLKDGINDGFLTPFKVKRFQTTLDEYIFTPDDDVLEGEVETNRLYKESDFNKIIEMKQREAKRVQLYMDDANQNEKAIVFCANQPHAASIRDLINQASKSSNMHYCVRVTANDGATGEQYLKDFQDNERSIPTILTTSQKLSTGVEARNVRNVVLLRPVNSMIEFKQIIGRGTRMFDGKDYFTIYDFVGAYKNFLDPEWDGEPLEPEPANPYGGNNVPKPIVNEPNESKISAPKKEKVKIKLADGKEREIKHMVSTSFWSADGTPVSAEQFLQNLFGKLPDFFSSEEELRNIWSNPITRKVFLEKLNDAGYGKDELLALQQLIDAENSDLFDVLEYVAFHIEPISRTTRVKSAQAFLISTLNKQQNEFLDFVLSKYVETGVEELDQEKLPQLLMLKYNSIPDATTVLGGIENIRDTFIGFQKYLYARGA
jgi:type I restriction enzyme, R subunit